MEPLKTIIVSIITALAKAVIKKYHPKIVVVTGSVGKTSTKDAISTVLASRFSVWKSAKSYNSDVGVPLTVLNCENGWRSPLRWFFNIVKGLVLVIFPFKYPEWLVLEVGADKPGDLGPLMDWIHPDIAVTTLFPDVAPHVEYYASPEALRAEESIPVFSVKDGGLVVLNADDDNATPLKNEVSLPTLTYGLLPYADVKGLNDSIQYEERNGHKVPIGMKFGISYKGESAEVSINNAIGIQQVYPILAAATVGVSQGVSVHDFPTIFKDHETPQGRMRIIEGLKDTVIIDDTYNSSPVALREALLTLQRLETGGRRIAVLGDMRELGSFSSDEHYKAGLLAGEILDMLVTVGPESRRIAEGALDAKMSEDAIFQFDSSREAGEFIEPLLRAGDTILCKGSQNTIRIEWTVEAIMAHPEDKEKLLVRQESAWKSR